MNEDRYLIPPPEDPRADEDFADYVAWQDGEIEAGRLRPPDEDDVLLGPVLFLGPGPNADPGLLSGRALADDGPADTLAPGPVLGTLTENAAADPASLTDNEQLGVITAARRQQAHTAWLELNTVAEFVLVNEARHQASIARGDRKLRRDGEYAVEELAFQLGVSRQQAEELADRSVDLKTRLPRTFDGLRTGVISDEKAAIIHRQTRLLSDADAAKADAELAEAAPKIRPSSLRAKARKAAQKLDPDLFQRAKDEGKDSRRVEAEQEESGNGRLTGRELDNTEVLAAKAALREEAHRLRRLGMPGTLDAIEAQIYLDRLNGINTAARHGLAPQPPDPAPDGSGPDNGDDGPAEGRGDPGNEAFAPDAPVSPAGGKTTPSVPAMINLLVPVSAAAGQPGALSDAGTYGFLDADDTQAFLAAASRDPRTRWCVTVVDPRTGHAVSHGCARGQRSWTPPTRGTSADEAAAALIRDLKPDFEPIATGAGNHGRREDPYTPSRKLAHLVRARTNTCPAPGCEAQALHNELDHTVAWPEGKTEESNISPPCARHHHAKHSPGWALRQPAPGIMEWRTPSGRTYVTEPTIYDL